MDKGMSRGNQETRKHKRKERKKRKQQQKRSLQNLEARTGIANEYRACAECGKTFWAIKRAETKCDPCRKIAKSFNARKRAALKKYAERKGNRPVRQRVNRQPKPLARQIGANHETS